MNVSPQPAHCLLCHKTKRIRSAGFRQGYKQVGRDSLSLTWWECEDCSGWFVWPVPTPSEIESHCNRANYNDPSQARVVSEGKKTLHMRLLSQMAKWTAPGRLLDVGCSFGEFMLLARADGWEPSGFDPYGPAAALVAQKGFDVRCEWVLEKAGFLDRHFAAVTAIDSFYYVWNPYKTLQTFHDLLLPGGVLAMRVTNKHAMLSLARCLSMPGEGRDARLTAILKGQFHSIGVNRLEEILRGIGFDRVEIEPFATTAQWNTLSLGTRTAYSVAQGLYKGTFGRVNLSPGVLIFAQKES